MVGKKIHQLIQHSQADGTAYRKGDCGIDQAIKAGCNGQVDSEVFLWKDGSSVPVAYWTRPLLRDGKVEGSVVSFQTIQ